jgi:molybdopterin/thiamine biosynthesis adenylyltransferase
MTRYTFTILEEHYEALRRTLFRDDREYGALLLCGRSRQVAPWKGEIEERFLVRELVEVPESAFLRRTPTSMTWSTTPLYNLAKRAMRENFAVCIAHSHPVGEARFSQLDDLADKESFEIVFGRMETERPHVSLVMDRMGEFSVRAFEPDLTSKPVTLSRVIGRRFRFRYPERGTGAPAEAFDRQVRVFGRELVEDLSQLRVGVVGCGGTGSAVASLLARLGVSQLVLVDRDRVDETNLNRLHFSTRADASISRRKVDVVGEAIAQIGLTRSIVRIADYADTLSSRDALRACDVIFGCTDDHLGRHFLNRLAYFYLIPVIDTGVLIEPAATGYDAFDGRVTVVQPGAPCQNCRKLISSQRMLEEGLLRNDPERYELHRRAGYIVGGADPSPVVVTFTTEIAAVAVNELLHRLTGFRGVDGHCSERVRRFDIVKDADTVPGGLADPKCKLCGRRTYDGRGDMEPFLDSA